MKLNKFDLEKKMSLADIRRIKAGCASSTSSGNSSSSSGADYESGDSDLDW